MVINNTIYLISSALWEAVDLVHLFLLCLSHLDGATFLHLIINWPCSEWLLSWCLCEHSWFVCLVWSCSGRLFSRGLIYLCRDMFVGLLIK